MDVALRKGDFDTVLPQSLINRKVEVAHDEILFHNVLDDAPQFHMQRVVSEPKMQHQRFWRRAVGDDSRMRFSGVQQQLSDQRGIAAVGNVHAKDEASVGTLQDQMCCNPKPIPTDRAPAIRVSFRNSTPSEAKAINTPMVPKVYTMMRPRTN